jgi:hypothetical protein
MGGFIAIRFKARVKNTPSSANIPSWVPASTILDSPPDSPPQSGSVASTSSSKTTSAPRSTTPLPPTPTGAAPAPPALTALRDSLDDEAPSSPSPSPASPTSPSPTSPAVSTSPLLLPEFNGGSVAGSRPAAAETALAAVPLVTAALAVVPVATAAVGEEQVAEGSRSLPSATAAEGATAAAAPEPAGPLQLQQLPPAPTAAVQQQPSLSLPRPKFLHV